MTSKGFEVRAMTRGDLDLAIQWAADEGWNPGLHDAQAFYAVDPAGFMMGVLDGEPIASISVVRYSASFGFLGFYIVKAEHRGSGFGMQLWNAAMKHLEGCNVGLDGVVEQQDNYRKSGFHYAYGNHRHQGIGGGKPPDGTRAASDVPVEWIQAYDAAHFPAPRASFVAHWLSLPGSRAFVMPPNNSDSEIDRISGYVVIRPCREGFKIGPLFADNADIADTLFRAAACTIPGEQLVLDVPAPNQAAIELAARHGLSPVFETARMYTGSAPDIPLDQIFGVTTFELG